MAAETNPPLPAYAAVKTPEEDDAAVAAAKAAAPSSSSRPGTAGRTDYDQWDRVTRDLVEDVEREDATTEEESKRALGLDGRYAHSKADEEERKKAKDVQRAKRVLERYQRRESAVRSELVGLLGPVVEVDDDDDDGAAAADDVRASTTTTTTTRTAGGEESKSDVDPHHPRTVRVTRDMIDAFKRVVNIADTSGSSPGDTIVLTSDLSLLESKMKVDAMKPKSYPEDSENDVAVAADAPTEGEAERKIHGLIKVFLSNVHSCTVIVKCKVISGTLEMNHCSDVVVRIERDATIATLQADLCRNVTVQFRDAPSGRNGTTAAVAGGGDDKRRIHWGEDAEDRIFHAGVKNMRVQIYRDGYLETERLCDYRKDGARAVGNATEEEFQFVTSCSKEGQLMTEAVVRERRRVRMPVPSPDGNWTNRRRSERRRPAWPSTWRRT
jgi:hypothetical protein